MKSGGSECERCVSGRMLCRKGRKIVRERTEFECMFYLHAAGCDHLACEFRWEGHGECLVTVRKE